MTRLRTFLKAVSAPCSVLVLCACGGGGSDAGSGNVPPPPPANSYTLQLVDASLEDTLSGVEIEASGLPVSGATARRD